jgi:hypothetical protein
MERGFMGTSLFDDLQPLRARRNSKKPDSGIQPTTVPGRSEEV